MHNKLCDGLCIAFSFEYFKGNSTRFIKYVLIINLIRLLIVYPQSLFLSLIYSH